MQQEVNKVKIVYDPKVSIRDLRRVYMILALDHFDGNKTKVANALGITVKSLYNWLKEFGISFKGERWDKGQASNLVASTFVTEEVYNAWRNRTGVSHDSAIG